MNNSMLSPSRWPGEMLKLLGQTGHIVDERLDEALGKVGLSITRLWVLRHLIQAGRPLPLSQLAERMAFVKSNVTYLMDRLEADGLVKRVPDPEDRRSILAALTDEGRRRYVIGSQTEADVEQTLLTVLSPQEAEQLAVLLERVIAGACQDH